MPHLPTMRWDYRDQLQATAQQVVNAGGIPETTWYVYDASGQRVRKVTESAVTAADVNAGKQPVRVKERIYLGGFEVYQEYGNDGSKTLERESLHIMDDKRRVALVETKTYESGLLNNLMGLFTGPETLIRYQFDNHLGSACLELDDKAVPISYEEFYPYGSTSYQAVNKNIKSAAKRYRYTGKERDEESGLYYHGARYYAPWLGKWVSCDPTGIANGANIYVYVSNCPIGFLDPNGKAKDYPSWRQMLAKSRIDAAEMHVAKTTFGTPEYSSAFRQYTASLKSMQEANETRDLHRNVGFPIAINLTMIAAAGPVAAESIVVRASFAFLSGFEIGETIQGQTVSLNPSSFGKTESLKGSDRIWHGVGAVSGVVASVAGEIQIARSKAILPKAKEQRVGGKKSRTTIGGNPLEGTHVSPSEYSGPWVTEANEVTRGGAVRQSREGSCVSAVGEMLTEGRVTEKQLLTELGEWSNPESLAKELNKKTAPSEWTGGGFPTEEDALRAAQRGPFGAELRVGPKLGHMVYIEPLESGGFGVHDPEPGICYQVDEAWIRKYVSGGVWKK